MGWKQIMRLATISLNQKNIWWSELGWTWYLKIILFVDLVTMMVTIETTLHVLVSEYLLWWTLKKFIFIKGSESCRESPYNDLFYEKIAKRLQENCTDPCRRPNHYLCKYIDNVGNLSICENSVELKCFDDVKESVQKEMTEKSLLKPCTKVQYSSLLICNHAVTNRHVVDIPPMLMNLDHVFPFFPSRLQLGWCFFNFSSCDFFSK